MLSTIMNGDWPTFLMQVLIRLIVVFTALPIHEYAHGWVAYKLGDYTAKSQGRLDMNPLRHFDPFGTTCLLLTGFGWAKPVPINPYNFKNPKKGMALTALAGPVSNLLLAAALMVIYKILYYFVPMSGQFAAVLMLVISTMISLNVGLAVFNLLPVPPLDGAKIFGYFIPDRYYWKIMQYEQYIAMALFAAVFLGLFDIPLSFLRSLAYDGIYYLTYFVDFIARLVA
jgi:Zn-dependent protease